MKTKIKQPLFILMNVSLFIASQINGHVRSSNYGTFHNHMGLRCHSEKTANIRVHIRVVPNLVQIQAAAKEAINSSSFWKKQDLLFFWWQLPPRSGYNTDQHTKSGVFKIL